MINFVKFLSDRLDPNFSDGSRIAEFVLEKKGVFRKSVQGGLSKKEQEAITQIMDKREKHFLIGIEYVDSEPVYSGSIEEKKKLKGTLLSADEIEKAKTFDELKSTLKKAAESTLTAVSAEVK